MKTPSSSPNPADYVFHSSEAASAAKLELQANQAGANRTLSCPFPGLDSYFVPMLPGQFAAVVGQTSNFKTGLMKMWENEEADRLTKIGRNAAIFHIATEDTLEDIIGQEVMRLAQIDMRQLYTGRIEDWAPVDMALARIGTTPIIRIAYSSANIPLKPTLNLSFIERCIEFACKKFSITDVASIFLDYLQALAPEDGPTTHGVDDDMRLRTRGNVFGFRRLIGRYKCAGVLGVQATTDLKYAYSSSVRLPSHYDGQETSAIGQHAQRVLSTWLPKMTPQVIKNGHVEVQGQTYKVEDNLLFTWLGKQQGPMPAGKIFAYRIDYGKQILKPITFGAIEKPIQVRPQPEKLKLPTPRHAPIRPTLPGLEKV